MEEIKNNNHTSKIIDIKDAIRQLVLLFLLIFAVMIVVYYPAKLLSFSSYVVPIAHISALLIMIKIIQKSKAREAVKRFKFNKVSLLVHPLVVLISCTLLVIIFPLLQILPIVDILTGISSSKDANFISIMIYGIILVPILEELLFRGFILEDFLKIYTPTKAIIYSSILFTIIHLNPPQFLTAFLVGPILGWLYYKTKSLIPCIVLHSTNNFTSGILFKYFSPNGLYFKDNKLFYYIFYFICLSVLGISILMINKKYKGNKPVVLQKV